MTPEQKFRYILVYRALHKGLMNVTNGILDPFGIASIPQVPNKNFIVDSGKLFLHLLFKKPNSFWEQLNMVFAGQYAAVDPADALDFYAQYRRSELDRVDELYYYWLSSTTTVEADFVRNALQGLLDKGGLGGWIECLKLDYQDPHIDRDVLNSIPNPQNYPLVNPVIMDSYEKQIQIFLSSAPLPPIN